MSFSSFKKDVTPFLHMLYVWLDHIVLSSGLFELRSSVSLWLCEKTVKDSAQKFKRVYQLNFALKTDFIGTKMPLLMTSKKDLKCYDFAKTIKQEHWLKHGYENATVCGTSS